MSYEICKNAIEKKNIHFIFDRFIVSELIYSKYLCRKPTETIHNLLNKDMAIIILYCTEKQLKKRMNERSDKHFKYEAVVEINRMYQKFFYENKQKFKSNSFFLLKNNNQNDFEYNINFIKKILGWN